MLEIKCYDNLDLDGIKKKYPELRKFIVNHLKKNGLKMGRGFDRHKYLENQFRIAENFDEFLKSFSFMCDSMTDIFKAMKILNLDSTYFLTIFIKTNSGSIMYFADIELLKENPEFLDEFYSYCSSN